MLNKIKNKSLVGGDKLLKLNKLSICIGAVLLAGNFNLAAQEVNIENENVPGDTAPLSEVKSYEVIEVKGVRGSLTRSLMQKRMSVGVTDSISAEDLGKFPDLNISESLQRIPGVTLNRNSNGEGQAINLRGLGPQFTLVEINGITGTDNGTGGRFGLASGDRGFNFELLAAELFSNVTVAKSPSASQTEGGMAGIVKLETPKPLSYQGMNLTTTVQGNYSDVTGDTDPRAAILFSNNIDDVFGVAFSLAYSDTAFRSDTAEGGSWRSMSSVGRGNSTDLIANGTRYYNFLEERDTLGSTLTLQYRPTDNLEVMLDAIYATMDNQRLANRNDMPAENPGPTLNTVVNNGVVTSGQFTGVQQRVGTNYYETDETLKQLALRATWTLSDNWTIRPFIGQSKRKTERVNDLYSFRLAENNSFDPGIVTYTVRGDHVDFSSDKTDFMSNPEDFLFNVFIFRPSVDDDKETTAKLDFEHFMDVDGLTSIEFGFRYADREKSLVQTQDRLLRVAGGPDSVPSLASVAKLLPFHVSGAVASPMQLSADPTRIREVFFPNGQLLPGMELRPYTSFNAAESWIVGEETFNAYFQANFEVGNASFNTGLRLVKTEQTATGSSVANPFLPSETITPVSVSNSYTRFLPSFNMRHQLQDDLILRLAYSETLSRPNLSSLSPSETIRGIDEGGGAGSKGNPNLQPFTADNFDLGLEWYFAGDGILAANLFYKDIDGLIDTASYTEVRSFPRQSDGVIVQGPIVFTTFENGASAKIKGAEFIYQQPLEVLDIAWLNSFGVVFNFTYADSTADFGNENDVRRTGLPGLSKKSFNASAYYDDGTLDVRLSYAWRQRYLAQFSDDFGVPRFTDDFGQLDLSANYRVSSQLQLQMQVLNLTNEQMINQSTDQYLPYGVNQLDRRVMFGARYTF